MRIAVCEDEREQANGMLDLIRKWAANNQVDVNVDTFFSAEEFLFHWSEGQPYDLAILDIKLRKMTGMDLAKIIRKTDQDLQIIFITGIADYVFEGYDVSALNYLLKPFSSEIFFKTFDKAYAITKQKESGALLVTQEYRMIRVPFQEILYMEIHGHYFDIVTQTMGPFRTKKQMNEMLSLLDKFLFIRCHRSFIINVSHVASISSLEVRLKNGQIVPLSLPYVQPVTQLFLEYHYKHNASLE